MCDFSVELMSSGAVECSRRHVYCVQCAVRSTPKNFGIRDVIAKSNFDQVLSAYAFKCCVCGIRGRLHRSTVIDAAVGALSVRCAFTAGDATCNWTGRLDQYNAHEHVFPDAEPQPSTRHSEAGHGTKRPGAGSNLRSEEPQPKRCRVQMSSDRRRESRDVQSAAGAGIVPDAKADEADHHEFSVIRHFLLGVPGLRVAAGGEVNCIGYSGRKNGESSAECFRNDLVPDSAGQRYADAESNESETAELGQTGDCHRATVLKAARNIYDVAARGLRRVVHAFKSPTA